MALYYQMQTFFTVSPIIVIVSLFECVRTYVQATFAAVLLHTVWGLNLGSPLSHFYFNSPFLLINACL